MADHCDSADETVATEPGSACPSEPFGHSKHSNLHSAGITQRSGQGLAGSEDLSMISCSADFSDHSNLEDARSPEPQDHPNPCSPEPQDHPNPCSPEPQDHPNPCSPEPQDHPSPCSPEPQDHPNPCSPEPPDHPNPCSPEPQDHPNSCSPEPQDHPNPCSPGLFSQCEVLVELVGNPGPCSHHPTTAGDFTSSQDGCHDPVKANCGEAPSTVAQSLLSNASSALPAPFVAGDMCRVCLGYSESLLGRAVEEAVYKMRAGDSKLLDWPQYAPSTADGPVKSLKVTLVSYNDPGPVCELTPVQRYSHALSMKDLGTRILKSLSSTRSKGSPLTPRSLSNSAPLTAALSRDAIHLAYTKYALALKLIVLSRDLPETAAGRERSSNKEDSHSSTDGTDASTCKENGDVSDKETDTHSNKDNNVGDSFKGEISDENSADKRRTNVADQEPSPDQPVSEPSQHPDHSKWRALAQICYTNAAHCHLEMSRFEDALACCNKALEEGPPNAKLHYRRGKAYSGCKEHGLAIGEYQRAAVLDSSIQVLVGKDISRAEAHLRQETALMSQRLKKMFGGSG